MVEQHDGLSLFVTWRGRLADDHAVLGVTVVTEVQPFGKLAKVVGYAFLVVEYEALKTGATEPAINFEFISDISDVRYSGGEGSLTNGAKVWAVYE